MIKFDLKAIGQPKKDLARLERLREIGVLNFSPKEKAEAKQLLREMQDRFKQHVARHINEDYPVLIDLANGIGFQSPNVYRIKTDPHTMTERFIGHMSLYDHKYRAAWAAWRVITDWFYPATVQDIEALSSISPADRARLDEIKKLSENLERIYREGEKL
jgi:hypothetical protein